MNLTDRIYVAVHLALTVLVCARAQHFTHWPWYVAWNALAIAAIIVLARKQHDGAYWEFAHDWLPALFFITVFEAVSFLSLGLRGEWQNSHLIAFEAGLFAVPPAVWLQRYSALWFTELLEFGYFSFYPLYPAVAGVLWAWRRRPRFAGGFRLIQGRAGVRGNAFPSSHVMLAFVVMVFCFRYFPRVAPWLLICVLLMCVGAVYDGYHYAIDVLAGALLGVTVGALFRSSNPAPKRARPSRR